MLWAYKKQHIGFTKEEMKGELNLSGEQWVWIHWMFFNGLNGEAPLIWSISDEFRLPGTCFGEKWYLSAVGISAAVDYLELKEAQQSGKRGLCVAVIAIIISILVSALQIYFDVRVADSQNKALDLEVQHRDNFSTELSNSDRIDGESIRGEK